MYLRKQTFLYFGLPLPAKQLHSYWFVLYIISLLPPSLSSSPPHYHPHQRHSSPAQQVDLDLRRGIVKGYSPYIRFLHSPTHPRDASCSAQAVLQIDLGGPFNRARFSLEYDNARLWTFHVSDSIRADGYGGRSGVTSLDDIAAEAEVHIFNRQLRVYANNLPGYLDAVIDGGLLLKVADNVVTNASRRVIIEISDEKVEWKQRNKKQSMESKFLFTLGGQNNSKGEPSDYLIYAGFNRVVGGNFRRGFGLCRASVTLHADRVDRCRPLSTNGKHQCHPDADCFNTTKSFRCKCKEGFYGNGKLCVDTNECEYDNGGCVHSCRNLKGNYECLCKEGFAPAPDGRDCVDRDECRVNNGGCEQICVNTMGHFQCLCMDGYHLSPDGRSCEVGRDWCAEDHGCPQHCERSMAGGVRCVCRPGYKLIAPSGGNRKCVDLCLNHNGGCQHRCTDNPHGPVCSCHNKYSLTIDKVSCLATCGVNNGGCDRICLDSPKGPVCSCPSGFKLNTDGKTCDDVDECLINMGGCSFGCFNTKGNYECVCPKGYRVTGDRASCEDIDECSSEDACDHICLNTPGSFQCTCRQGYELYGGTHCADKNECSMSNGGCEHTCENTEGGYTCGCHSGYRLHSNTKDCVESMKCSTLRFPAKVQVRCSITGTDEVCKFNCTSGSQFTSQVDSTFVTRCGPAMDFRWTHEIQNFSLPSCSEHVLAPGFKSKGKLTLYADHCKMVKKRNYQEFEKQLNSILIGSKPNHCEDDLCSVTFLDLKCEHRKRKFRHLIKNKLTVVSGEFELQVKPAAPTEGCGLECKRQEMERKMKLSFKRLRREINTNYRIKYEGRPYEVTIKPLKSVMENVCAPGQVLVHNKCVMCSLATFYSNITGKCESCPPGTYQDEEGQVDCKPCKDSLNGVPGAKSALECGEACSPGSYSENGLKPCRVCPIGTYQPDFARTLCLPCGPGILTSKMAATGFNDCLVPEKCRPGHFFSRDENKCIPCSADTYQPCEGQNFCIDCPGDTQTDREGANSSVECKERKCGGVIGHLQGFIQSPNWPGLYPSNVECTWKITPEKGRRILVVIPEIHLVGGDRCRDFLVLRKTASPYSLTTFETCESSETPVAFTARSRSLWIYFKTDSENNAKGFSIPYVTYNEDYQELIDDIVRDGRLYNSYQHQEVLKNRKLLSSLMEVIAHPYNYFKYANSTQSLFPESFIKLLKNKVIKFFN